jgi:hypothetical protein
MMQSNKLFALLFIFVSHFSFSNQSEISDTPCNKPVLVNITSPALIGTESNKRIAVCYGDDVLVALAGEYIAGSGVNSESYQYSWYKKGSTPVYVNNSTISIKSLTAKDAGTWILRIEDGNEGSAQCYTEDSVKFEVIPNPLVTISGSGVYCLPGTTDLVANAGLSSYVWTKGNNPTGIGSSSVLTIYSPGIYKVVVTDANGCKNTAMKVAKEAIVSATIQSIPKTIVCEGETIVLTTLETADDYSWKRNGTVVGIGPVYTATETGVYEVELTYGAIPGQTCVANDTQALVFNAQSSPECSTIAGVSQNIGNLIYVSPNPSNGLFKVNFPVSVNGSVKINIYNTLGEAVYSKIMSQNSDSSTLIDLQNSSSGVYFMEIETNDGIAVKRIVKQ